MCEKILTRAVSSASTRSFDLELLESCTRLNLPSNKDILRRFFHIGGRSKYNNRSRDIASQIYDELQEIYERRLGKLWELGAIP